MLLRRAVLAALLAALALGLVGFKEVPTENVVNVVDSEPDGDFDQADIDAAVAQCTTTCRLVFPDDTFTDVAWVISDSNVRRVENAHVQAPTPITQSVVEIKVDGLVWIGGSCDGQKGQQVGPSSGSSLGTATGADCLLVSGAEGVQFRGTDVFDVPHHGFHFTLGSHNGVVDGGSARRLGCHTVDEPCPALGEDTSGAEPSLLGSGRSSGASGRAGSTRSSWGRRPPAEGAEISFRRGPCDSP